LILDKNANPAGRPSSKPNKAMTTMPSVRPPELPTAGRLRFGATSFVFTASARNREQVAPRKILAN
jgi:hypothetical protein